MILRENGAGDYPVLAVKMKSKGTLARLRSGGQRRELVVSENERFRNPSLSRCTDSQLIRCKETSYDRGALRRERHDL